MEFNSQVVNALVLLLLAAADAAPREHNEMRAVPSHRSEAGAGPGMWFGPRLGRRLKRNLQPSTPGSEQLARLVDLVEDAPWLLLAINGNDLVSEGKRHTVNFTPRLGRDSGEEQAVASSSGDHWLTAPDSAPDLMPAQRSPPFAPRLGRARYLV